jgi:type VI secretion system protein ImpK
MGDPLMTTGQPEQPRLDSEPTIIKPTPGRSRRAPVLEPTRPFAPVAAPAPPLLLEEISPAGMPPLVAAAFPLLNLVRQLRDAPNEPDLEMLRRRVIEAIKLFERMTLSVAVAAESARAAHYALCATIDDVLLSTRWGIYTVWSRQGMVSTFHMDVTGGERFFDLLEHLHRDPGTHRDALLLMYYCLSLGFEGRMRINPQGALELARVREGLYRTLRATQGEFERELAPHWRGIDARHQPLSVSMVLSTIAATTVLALTLLFFGLNGMLSARSDVTLQQLADLPPKGAASLKMAAPTAPPPTAPPPIAPPPVAPPAPKLQTFLDDEIRTGLVTVSQVRQGTLVRIRNRGLFATGSASVQDRFVPLIDKIGAEIGQEGARVLVVGHTDNVPINTFAFRSNWQLSQERARQVARILGRHVSPALIQAEGRGETEPADTNDTPEGREANRRTELIVIQPQPGSMSWTSSAGTTPPATGLIPTPTR